MGNKNQAPSISDLLKLTHNGGSHENLDVSELILPTESGYDAYNPSAIFEYRGRDMLAARVEPRAQPLLSTTVFYSHDAQRGVWYRDESIPALPLQDPFVTQHDGQWLVGGVRVHTMPGNPQQHDYWETQIFAGESLEELRHLFTGPRGMKDIRPVTLGDRLGIFTRPQGRKGGRGRIGFTMVSQFSDLTPQLLYDAPLIDGVVAHGQGEWGGINEAHFSPETGFVWALGHLGRFVTDRGLETKDYKGITFVFDPGKNSVSKQQLVVCRDCFPDHVEAKSPVEKNVVFPSSIALNGTTAVLTAGVSDAGAWQIRIANPFI